MKKILKGFKEWLGIAGLAVGLVTACFGEDFMQNWGPPVFFFFAGFLTARAWDCYDRRQEKKRTLLELRALTKNARTLLARVAPSGSRLVIQYYREIDTVVSAEIEGEKDRDSLKDVSLSLKEVGELVKLGLLSRSPSLGPPIAPLEGTDYQITPKGVEFYDVGLKAGLFDGL